MRWRRLLMRQEQIGTARSIALAVICVGLATLARAAMGFAGALLPFPTFFPAELVAALIGGRRRAAHGGAVALVVWCFHGADAATPIGAEPLGDLALFTLSGLIIVWLASLHRRLVFELEDNEKARSMLASEIQHRSANLLLVMTSLVRQSVPDPAVAMALIDRMRTVAKSDNLLDPSRGPGPAQLVQLVEDTVRRPYGTHVSVAGPDVGLDAAQAHGLRLMLHEMATNAAKYGALSNGHGKVAIDWHRHGDTLNIVWRESGGPL